LLCEILQLKTKGDNLMINRLFKITKEKISVSILLVISLVMLPSNSYSQDDQLEKLIKNLRSEEWETREEAAQLLGDLKDHTAIVPLISVLKDEHPFVRKKASWALGEIGDTMAVKPLITVLTNKDEDWWDREAAALALGKIGSPAVEPLITVLNNNNLEVRKALALALGEIKDHRVVKPLIMLLNDQSIEVRLQVAMALRKIKDPESVEPLIAILKDKNEYSGVRAQAIYALIDMDVRDTRLVDLLIATLKDEDVSYQAAQALGEMKVDRAVTPLINALKEIIVERDPFRAQVENIAECLVKIGIHSVEPLISLLADSSREIQWYAAKSLGEIKDTRATKRLTKALKDEDLLVVAAAYRFFIIRGEKNTESVLIKALDQYSRLSPLMVQDFCYSGNIKLKDAAESWAKSHGYFINFPTTRKVPKWGEGY
jgi:HEAT repeat protein